MILKKLVAHCSVGFAKVIAESVNFWQKKDTGLQILFTCFQCYLLIYVSDIPIFSFTKH